MKYSDFFDELPLYRHILESIPPPAKHFPDPPRQFNYLYAKHIHLTATSREPIPKAYSEHELRPKLLTEVDVLHVCYWITTQAAA